MNKAGCVVIGLIVTVIALILLAPTHTMSAILLDMLYVHPFSWTLLVIGLAFAVVGIMKADDEVAWPWFVAILVGVLWIGWLIIQKPLMYAELYKNTVYEVDSDLVEQSSIRDIPYTVASTNFTNTNPDSKTGPGDLDFVNGKWIASVNPTNIWNKFSMPTQGFFQFDPSSADEVVKIVQQMPYAEGGFFGNSETFYVRSKDYFSEFSEILYVQDPENKEVFAIVSLMKRAGFSRYPYVSSVMIIHGDGNYENLTIKEAEADPRLKGIALKPEWLMEQEVIAYGYRYGVGVIFSRDGRIELQSSNVNDENKPPFHIETKNGNYWYTPYSPLVSKGLKGIAMSASHDIDGPVYIWQLPANQAYGGADFMTSLIEGSPAHRDYAWYRQTGETKCGNITVLEMVPVIREEPNGNKLYFLGYVSTAPNSVEVLFYSIVDPESQVVYEDMTTPAEVNSWLRGDFELKPQTETDQIEISTTGVCSIEDIGSQLTEDLIKMIDNILAELERRIK